MFIAIKLMYQMNVYKNSDVADFVKWNNINTDQYKQITGEEYTES